MKHQRQERRQVQVEKVKEKHVSLCLSPTPGHRTWELLSGQQVRTERVWNCVSARWSWIKEGKRNQFDQRWFIYLRCTLLVIYDSHPHRFSPLSYTFLSVRREQNPSSPSLWCWCRASLTADSQAVSHHAVKSARNRGQVLVTDCRSQSRSIIFTKSSVYQALMRLACFWRWMISSFFILPVYG